MELRKNCSGAMRKNSEENTASAIDDSPARRRYLPYRRFLSAVYIPSNEHQEKVCSQEVAFSFLGAASWITDHARQNHQLSPGTVSRGGSGVSPLPKIA